MNSEYEDRHNAYVAKILEERDRLFQAAQAILLQIDFEGRAAQDEINDLRAAVEAVGK